MAKTFKKDCMGSEDVEVVSSGGNVDDGCRDMIKESVAYHSFCLPFRFFYEEVYLPTNQKRNRSRHMSITPKGIFFAFRNGVEFVLISTYAGIQ